MDLIDRQAAIDALAKTMPTPATPDGAGEFDHEIHIADEAFADAIRIIESIEPADVVPVVRCKDCKFWGESLTEEERNECDVYADLVCTYWMSDGLTRNDFCSKGERREDEID